MVRISPELFRFKTWPEAAKTKEPPKFPVGVPPPKTTTACPGFKIVFAGNSWLAVLIESLSASYSLYPLISRLVAELLTNSTNSSSLASLIPSPLASPRLPLGGSYSTSFKTKP